jgi:hypothetical protein
MNARIVVLLAAAAAAGAWADTAAATVFKCRLDDGGVFYQDRPCAAGHELRDFDKDPANVSVVPFARPAAAAPTHPAARAGRASPSSSGRASGRPREKARPGDAAQRRFLSPGMSEGEVVARVGRPDMTSSRTRKGVRWTYMPVPEDAHTITSVQLENGQVVGVERKVVR